MKQLVSKKLSSAAVYYRIYFNRQRKIVDKLKPIISAIIPCHVYERKKGGLSSIKKQEGS
jgi:hypothetical protein